MNNKYSLTRQQNLFLAKKVIGESVYCGIRMEGAPITFPEILAILSGVNVPNATIDDIQKVLNLRDAWKYLLQTIGEPFSLDYICRLNDYIARNESLEWGVLRNGTVGIDGTDYRPQMPDRNEVEKYISVLLNSSLSETEKAIEYFLWGCRSQLFWDGNKRTSLFAANKLMIESGAGVIYVPDKHIPVFNKLLIEFYETNENKQIKQFIYDTSICGIEFAQESKKAPPISM